MSTSTNSFLKSQRKSDLLELAEEVGLKKYVCFRFCTLATASADHHVMPVCPLAIMSRCDMRQQQPPVRTKATVPTQHPFLSARTLALLH